MVRRGSLKPAISVAAALLGLALVAPALAQRRSRVEPPPQFVLFGFDATPHPDPTHDPYVSIARSVARYSHGAGHITLFLNQQFFMLAHDWSPPPGSRWAGHPETYRAFVDPVAHVRMVLTYARDPDEIAGRIATTRILEREGHELASHGTRHGHGRAWSSEQWQGEFAEYETYMRNVVGLSAARGFRAPYLEWSMELHRVESARGMIYDASHTQGTVGWPARSSSGVWLLGVPLLYVPSLGRRIVAFDDSYHLRGLTAVDVEQLYTREFDGRYRGNRAPLILASHGGYTGPALRLASRVCRMADVRCTSHRELAEYMSAHGELAGRRR